jgi:PKHD-type hydroxylase
MQIRPIFNVNHNINQTEYYWYQEGFSVQELEWFENLKELYPYEQASIVGSTSLNTEVRDSRIKWINLDENSMWVYDKLMDLSIDANNRIWGFNLHSIIDLIQYTEYPEGGGHYDWHLDIGPDTINHRKISIVVQLSDPSEYEGGDLEIWSGGQFRQIPKMKGCVVLFPSFLLHRVTPVIKGLRKSMVLWIGGDSYR